MRVSKKLTIGGAIAASVMTCCLMMSSVVARQDSKPVHPERSLRPGDLRKLHAAKGARLKAAKDKLKLLERSRDAANEGLTRAEEARKLAQEELRRQKQYAEVDPDAAKDAEVAVTLSEIEQQAAKKRQAVATAALQSGTADIDACQAELDLVRARLRAAEDPGEAARFELWSKTHWAAVFGIKAAEAAHRASVAALEALKADRAAAQERAAITERRLARAKDAIDQVKRIDGPIGARAKGQQ